MGESDGFLFGPMPSSNWSIAFNINTDLTFGLANLQVASYSNNDARVSFSSVRVKKLDASYGGGLIEAQSCSSYCQIYDNCGECVQDSRCQFAPLNGGCISSLVNVPSFDCPAPATPAGKLIADGGSTMALKIRRPDAVFNTCPCAGNYYYYVVVFDLDFNEKAYNSNIPMREGHRFTNALIPGLQQNTQYQVWVWACSRDQCATTALVQEVTTGFDAELLDSELELLLTRDSRHTSWLEAFYVVHV